MIDSDDDVDSKITIGGYSSEKYGAPGSKMVWHDLQTKDDKYNHWRLNMDALHFGEFLIEDTKITSVIVDSGTSLVLMPKHEFEKLMQLIEFKGDILYSVTNDFGLQEFPCFKESTYASMPNITFSIDGTNYTIPPASYIGYQSGMCTLKIMTNNKDTSFLTLGLNFFENYYSVFDVANKRIGLQRSRFSKNHLDLEESWVISNLSSMLLNLARHLGFDSEESLDNWHEVGSEKDLEEYNALQEESIERIFVTTAGLTLLLLLLISSLLACQCWQSHKRYREAQDQAIYLEESITSYKSLLV